MDARRAVILHDDASTTLPRRFIPPLSPKVMGNRYSIGHSPDPDDAFMFYAMTESLIDMGGREYDHVLVDIQTLNQQALDGTHDVSAVSIHSYPTISESYALMNCGASMGEGYGPMIISHAPSSVEEAKDSKIAIPGMGTSAYLSLRLALGEVDVQVMPFDEILPSVAAGESTHGLIIHEGQLTWRDEGVHLVLDLGVWWNEKTGLPLPLGGNVVLRSHGEERCAEIANDVRNSIEHAIQNPDSALSFAKKWGRGISDETNEKFVGMYVNERTIDYGPDGREAVMRFLEEGQKIGLVDPGFEPRAIDFIGRQ